MKLILLLITLFTFNTFGQIVVLGSIKNFDAKKILFESRCIVDTNVTFIDSLGNFQAEIYNSTDTLKILVSQPFMRNLIITGIPLDQDTVLIIELQVFQSVRKTVRIINLKNRRAYRKYNRTVKNEYQANIQQSVEDINSTHYLFRDLHVPYFSTQEAWSSVYLNLSSN